MSTRHAAPPPHAAPSLHPARATHPARPARPRRTVPLTLVPALVLAVVLAGLASAAPAPGPDTTPGVLAGSIASAARAPAARAALLPSRAAKRSPAPRRIEPAELERVTGGICTTCSSEGSGGGGGGDGSSGAPVATGTPYWETYRVSSGSSSTTPGSLATKITNYSDRTINGTFSYTLKVVRSVQFSGGYASFIRASIGGEVSRITQTSVTYPIEPRTFGKLYVRYRTERRTYFGRRYQDYTDGSRTVVGTDSGPYESTSTVLGYVTGAL